MMSRIGVVLCLLPFALVGSEPTITWNFDSGPKGHTGRYNAFQSRDCDITLQLTAAARRGEAGQGMRIAYNNRGGPCGIWMQLFADGDPAARKYPDIREYPFLSLWVRGETGLEDAEVRIADPAGLAREDSNAAGLATRYLPGSMKASWSEVVIPFADFHLRSPLAAVFVLSFPPGTEGVLQVDDVSLKRNAADPVPISVSSNQSSLKRRPQRAMWLWETARIIDKEEQQRLSIENLLRAHVDVLFLQLPYTASSPDGSIAFAIEHATELRSFLRAAHASGIAVHALDGYPEFSLREMRPAVLRLVRGILAFNRESSPLERFDGIHLDVEPHQLLGFDSPFKERILIEFVELQKEIRTALQEETTAPVYGIDIPFWFHAERVSFQGIEQELTRHVLAFADNAGIMAYRRSATGPDSIIANAVVTVEHATQAGKSVYVGVETEAAGDAKISFACSVPETEWQSEAGLSWEVLRMSNIDGFSLRSRREGFTRFIGLAESTSREPVAYRRALDLLSSKCGNWPGRAGAMRQLNPLRQFTEAGEAKITFAQSTLRELDMALDEVTESLIGQNGFAGTAIHSYTSYLKMR